MTPIHPQHIFTADQQEGFFEHSLCGFIITDAKGVILKSNERVTNWSGYKKEELKEKRFTDLLSVGGRIYYETHLSPMLRMQGSFDEVLLEIKTITGERFRTLVNALEIRNSSNELQYVQIILFKASDRLQYEQNLQLARQSAEGALSAQKEIVTLREQLIAILGHDLRNPLAAVKMGVELLGYTPLDNQQQNTVNILRRNASRMHELVDNIMDFARTRLGDGIVLNKQLISLAPVLNEVIQELQLVYPARTFITHIDMPAPVYCDSGRMGQLLSNLVANALTHGTPDMPINITAVTEGAATTIKVSNSGEPIPEALREKLFDPFTREDGRKSQNGLGLGLYICSQIAIAHNASLTCISTKAETSFIFTMIGAAPEAGK